MKDNKKNQEEIKENKPTRASFHPGSTTQGGSNFGQGSAGLGKQSIKQGTEAGSGSNYENEQGWNNEALRTSDSDPEQQTPKSD
ncbi:hypothetical protein GWC95_11940 [Sediminibacterium roseum]|uniref:Uncharacterized protein n=1 Tax=Sediminibacterium roseum TaxID=1978412 RepID=A0ABW9ZU24_9BACT|nr:hypothetical protein [Sediminibacterium roseum]NCI50639.1 hypothetical protein [Sediminibacterium roseum]